MRADVEGVPGTKSDLPAWVLMPSPTMGLDRLGVPQCEAKGWELRSDHQGEKTEV